MSATSLVSRPSALLLLTKYTRGREHYFASSEDGRHWSDDQKLAGMGGHYQISCQRDERVGTAFNMHPGGNVDGRTNLYYAETPDGGTTWQTIDGQRLDLPLEDIAAPALVRDAVAEGRLVYVKDMDFDAQGRPVILVVTSDGHQPGPQQRPRRWTLVRWDGQRWQFHEFADALHNYDMGSLYLEENQWRVIAPTEPGPQLHGTGGEIAVWTSRDRGQSWTRQRQLTAGSPRNHGYVRRPLNAQEGFYGFWADGDPDRLSRSHLYFTDRRAESVWRLPYEMAAEQGHPERVSAER